MTDQPAQRASSILALDFGLRRIGVATANTLTGTASALTTLGSASDEPDWAGLDTLIAEWEPDLLVLGLPYNADGSDSDMTQLVEKFQRELESRYALKVVTTDERHSSQEAEMLLKQARRQGEKTKRITREDVDSLAAKLIAERWLANPGAH
jgi:putative Holliday junction resolvase